MYFSNITKTIVNLLATCFYVGKIPVAPGTFGSIAGVIMVLLFSYNSYGSIYLPFEGNLKPLIFATLKITIIGFLCCRKYEQIFKIHDDKRVVIDEVAGVFFTFLILFYMLATWPIANNVCNDTYWAINYLLVPFIAFRFFDIIKPWPVSWADNLKHSAGVMLDDIIAGILAGIVCYFYLMAFDSLFWVGC